MCEDSPLLECAAEVVEVVSEMHSCGSGDTFTLLMLALSTAPLTNLEVRRCLKIDSQKNEDAKDRHR